MSFSIQFDTFKCLWSFSCSKSFRISMVCHYWIFQNIDFFYVFILYLSFFSIQFDTFKCLWSSCSKSFRFSMVCYYWIFQIFFFFDRYIYFFMYLSYIYLCVIFYLFRILMLVFISNLFFEFSVPIFQTRVKFSDCA